MEPLNPSSISFASGSFDLCLPAAHLHHCQLWDFHQHKRWPHSAAAYMYEKVQKTELCSKPTDPYAGVYFDVGFYLGVQACS